jgi:glycosyltransferase involved in cell wall biosynthesis
MTPAPRPIRVLELRSVRGTGGGPEKTILSGAAQADPRRVQVTVCYLRDARDEIFGIDRRAAALGIDYVEVRERHSFDPSAWIALRRLVRERGIDIVHAHEYKTDLLTWWLSRVEGIVPLSTVHGWSGHSWRERCVYYPADLRVLVRYPRVIAVSSEITRVLVGAGADPSRISTIANGIDHRTFRRDRAREADARRALGLAAGDRVIGVVCRLDPGKGLERLVDAVADLRQHDPRVRLVLVGDGSLRESLERETRARLGPACLFTGHRSDIVDLHHAFDLFVHPSDHEGSPNAVLEAMALETPLVATDAGGTADLAQHEVHGLIVPCQNRAALAAAMQRALADPAASAARAAAARRRVEQALSFEARMRAVEAIYVNLMEERSRWNRDRRHEVA